MMFFKHKIFSTLLGGKALRTAVLVLGLLGFGRDGFAQEICEMQYTDTIGRTTQWVTINFHERTCLNTTKSIHQFLYRIKRPSSASAGKSWLDANWTFPNANWSINLSHANSKSSAEWDSIVFEVAYDGQQSANRNLVMGGEIKGEWPDGEGGNLAVARTELLLRPSTTAVDSIKFNSEPFCQGAFEFTALPNKGDTISVFVNSGSYADMYYKWTLTLKSGATIQSTPTMSSSSWDPSTESGFDRTEWFNASTYEKVTVQRAFCNIASFGTGTTSALAPSKEREFKPYDLVSNPPLDTVSKEDTLYRLVWWSDSATGQEAQGEWRSVPMSDPICVNYYDPDVNGGASNIGKLISVSSTVEFAPAGFTASGKKEQKQAANGYLFFQVGSKPDTSVRYQWIYDTALLERVFVGEGSWLNANIGASSNRWKTLMKGGDLLQYNSGYTNNGGFGQTGRDSTFRAIFRVKALSPERREELADRPEGDGIVIKVIPICYRCKDSKTASGYFENDTLSSGYLGTPKRSGVAANQNRAWDTIRPMKDFQILKVKSVNSGTLSEDIDLTNADCLGSTMYFNVKFTNALYDEYSELLEEFEISKFVGGVYKSDDGKLHTGFEDSTVVNPGAMAEVKSIVKSVDAQPEQQKNYVKYMVGANECFTRKLGDINVVTNDTVTFKTPADSNWARTHIFSIQRPPRQPAIWDPYENEYKIGNYSYRGDGSKQEQTPDTIIICSYPLLDSVGNALPSGQIGIKYILENQDDSLTLTNKQGNPNVWPTNRYYGWPTVQQGESIGMEAFFENETPHRGSVMIVPMYDDDGSIKAQTEGLLMFAASGLCGRGDSVVIPYKLRDTFSMPLDIGYSLDSNKTGTPSFPLAYLDWDDMAYRTFCENTDVYFRWQNDLPNDHRVIWTHPKSWKSFYPSEQISGNFLRAKMTIGQDSGRVSFHTVNQCGGNKGVYSPKIRPIEYYKADWITSPDTICEDSVYVYSLNDIQPQVQAGIMSDFYIKFPDDWEILWKSTGTTTNGGSSDTATESELSLFGFEDLSYNVQVGQESGPVLVRWLTEGCDINNQVRPEWWDTLKVFTRIYPEEPLMRDVWKDTVCANDTLWYSVKPTLRDSLQDNYYIWSFPATWTMVDSTSNKDSVRMFTGDAFSGTDTIRVTAMCLDCDKREGGTLKFPVSMGDTAVFTLDLILDAMTGEQFGIKPCAEDTIQLYVNKPYLVDSIHWQWGLKAHLLGHNIPEALQIESSQWFFTDTTALPDTLAIVSQNGSDTLFIQMSMRNICGWSRSPIIALTAANVIQNDFLPVFDRFDSVICGGAEGIYSVVPVDDADRYIWRFPWRDTTVFIDSEVVLIPMVPTDTGDVYVIAANNCSQSDTSWHYIDTVRRIPLRPYPVNFAQAMLPAFGEDTLLLDTTCKHSDFGLKVLANPGDDDLTLKFNWLKLGGDTALQSPPLFENIPDRTDTITVKSPNPVASVKRTHTYMGVAASQTECSVNGDTLRLLLVSIDTVRTSSLGKILMSDPAPCFGSTVTFRVEKDSAFAYRWILPDNDTNYRFVGDTTKDSVRIQIGKKPAKIGVVSTTGLYCGLYENQIQLLSDSVKPIPAPELEVFEQFIDSICEGDMFTFKVRSKATGTQPEAYHWIFPDGWGIDTITQADSITVTIGRNSGKIFVAGIDSCNSLYPNEGELIDSTIFVFRMPEITIKGDLQPCYGETYTYELQKSDQYVDYTPSVTAVQPTIIITEHYPYVDIEFNGDSVNFAFSNISHARCPSLIRLDYEITVLAFTMEQASLSLTESVDTVCFGSTHRFVVKNANETDTASRYAWTLPETWKNKSQITGVFEDTLEITFDSLPAVDVNSGVIQVNVRTKCYTDTNPVKHVVVVDTIPLPSPVLDATKGNQPFFQRPCQGDTMVLFVQENNPRYTVLGWTWNGSDTIYPESDSIFNGWRLYDTAQARRGDTLSLIVSKNAADTLRIAVRVKNSCDSIKTYDYVLVPTNIITEKTMFVQLSNNVCSNEAMTFTLNPPSIAENFYWHFSWDPTHIDTIYNSPEHKFVVPTTSDTAKIWVIPANGCGTGPNSDTLIIDTILSRPHIVKPLNFALNQESTLVRDTACMRSDHSFVVQKNPADALIDVTFNWFYESGDSLPNMHANATGDTLFVPADLLTNKRGKRTLLGVSATREFCHEPGDTLWFELILVDTVPLFLLNGITYTLETTHSSVIPSSHLFCSMDTIMLSTRDLTAAYSWAPVSYRWVSYDTTWQIISDTTAHEIRVVIGTQPGVFSVTPLTDYNQRFCSYPGRTLMSDTMKLFKDPVLDSFVGSLADTVCAELPQMVKVALNPASEADAYQFTLYKQLYRSTQIDSSEVIVQKADSLEITPIDGLYDKITISVQAVDSCCVVPLLGNKVIDSFVILNSPNVFLIGDTLPCRDSAISYVIEPSDAYVTYDFGYIHTPGVLVDTTFLPNIDVNFLGDSVYFIFDNILHNGFCANLGTTPYTRIYAIASDTTPDIPFTVQFDTLRCMNDTVMLIAKKDPGFGHDVSFVWSLPSTSVPWVINRYVGENSDTAVLVSPNYADGYSHYDTILVYASGTCGTSRNAQKAGIKVDPTPVYNFALRPNSNIQICEDSVLTLWVQDNSPFDDDDLNEVKIRWEYPKAPMVDGDDTLRLKIPKGSFWLSVRFFKEGTCGYSAPTDLEKYINVNDQPAVPKILQNPWPCKDLSFDLSVAPDVWSDTIMWDSIGSVPAFEMGFSALGYSVNDSLHFDSVGQTPFQLIAKAINKCGWRSDTILVTPSDSIKPFLSESLDQFYPPYIRYYCAGDTIMKALKLPAQHVNTKPEYHWTFPPSWTYIKDSINEADSTNMVWFIPGEAKGEIGVWADSKTGCGVTDVVMTAEITPTVIKFEASQAVDTTVYKTDSIVFYVSSDKFIINGNPSVADFNLSDFSWTPQNRFAISGDTARLIYAYLTNEIFIIKATHSRTGCKATDTVYLHVEGSYETTVTYPDSVCSNADFPLQITHTGGEPDSYSRQWFRYDTAAKEYVRFNDMDDMVWDTVSSTDMKYLVVGMNSLFGDPTGTVRVPVFDSTEITIKAVPPIFAKIDTLRLVQVRGDNIRELTDLRTGADSVRLGERVRFYGKIIGEGRPDNYPHYLYEWWIPEDLYGYIPADTFEHAGYNRTDSLVVHSGLIFYPQSFYLAVEDTGAYGCFSIDSVFIGIRYGEDEFDFGRIPSGFSPRNGDGVNDIFMKGVDELTIVNRWGMVLYQSSGKEGWDGRESKTKRMVEPGDYFFILTVYQYDNNKKPHTKTGVITVF